MLLFFEFRRLGGGQGGRGREREGEKEGESFPKLARTLCYPLSHFATQAMQDNFDFCFRGDPPNSQVETPNPYQLVLFHFSGRSPYLCIGSVLLPVTVNNSPFRDVGQPGCPGLIIIHCYWQ